ncbi:hypothetical protein K3N28_02215 [Glycomyces sp. TRM65418]|uniref:hypothetical protein n=1 Tax=Glycomyces sp. TRM65418 TaxID=2867006 RepID=UPI001CE68CBE|nr:hypothetical protein [Glycomyces sp. TRM65418]MCC3761888.1 hypothetical protein [Glycomyces sp. TRM65418]QZD55968.1 hypothetical protein K3N28_02205 [Glycomyces sp. TRM65418]
MESFPTGNESRTVHVYEGGEAVAEVATGDGVALPVAVAYSMPGQIVTNTGAFGDPVLSARPPELW